MSRCIPIVEAEGKPHDQAVAICATQYRENRSASMPEVKHLDVPFEIKQVNEAGEFEGYGSVFDVVDLHNERVARGAFEESLKEWREKGRMPPMLWQHNMDEPIGVFLEMAEDDKGLRVKGQLLIDDVAKAREARALMQHRVLGGLSIGFMAIRDSFDQRTEVRTLEQIKLMEVSAVTFPANEAAMIESVRSMADKVMSAKSLSEKSRSRLVTVIDELSAMADESGLYDDDGSNIPPPKSCERALREAGASKHVAAGIIAHGHSHVVREAEREAGSLTDAEQRFATFITDATKTAETLFVQQEG